MDRRTRMNFVIIVAALYLQPHVNAVYLNVSNEQEEAPEVLEKSMVILKTCFAPRVNTLVISEDLSRVAQDVRQNVPENVILINDNFDPDQSHGSFPPWLMFLLGADSEVPLMTMLQKLKLSDLWNSASTFFIANTKRVGCEGASGILHADWKMNLLASFYICKESAGRVLLYTYNPFTKRTIPGGWEKVETADSDERWTLHRRLYSEGPEMCEHLEFDKTEYLDYYQIKAITWSLFTLQPRIGREDSLQIFKENSYYPSYMTFANMISTFKITAAIYYDEVKTSRKEGTLVEIDQALANGIYDVAFSATFRANIKDFINIRIQSDLGILTSHRNFLTPVEKIVDFYSGGTVALIFLAMFITWFIFIFRNNGRLFAAVLEVLRVFLSTSVLQPLRGNSIRIYLFGIWWFVIILNATFQGKINAFLTKPERFDVKTLDDLRRYNYHIYMNGFYFKMLSDHLTNYPNNHVHIVEDNSCYSYVLNNTLKACIQSIPDLLSWAQQHNLHITVLELSPWVGFCHRPDWPLAKKMEHYISRLAASGLGMHWYTSISDAPMKKLQFYEERETDPQIRKIQLNDLTFAFVLLGIGLTFATFVLILEIYNAKNNQRRRMALKASN